MYDVHISWKCHITQVDTYVHLHPEVAATLVRIRAQEEDYHVAGPNVSPLGTVFSHPVYEASCVQGVSHSSKAISK